LEDRGSLTEQGEPSPQPPFLPVVTNDQNTDPASRAGSQGRILQIYLDAIVGCPATNADFAALAQRLNAFESKISKHPAAFGSIAVSIDATDEVRQ
jgi:hypothetical protein